MLKPARRHLAGLAAWLAVLAACFPAQAQGETLELAVKATYLYKFVPFVEWPAAAFADPAAPLNLCVLGEDPFGDVLDRAVAGQQAGERAIAVRRPTIADAAASCQIAYIGGPEETAARALDALRGRPVLTVTDESNGTGFKGIVHFVVRDNRVRFQIDGAAAARNGIALSSKLLSLAVSVRPR